MKAISHLKQALRDRPISVLKGHENSHLFNQTHITISVGNKENFKQNLLFWEDDRRKVYQFT